MNIKDISRDDILNALGLETRKTPTDVLMPALGVFGAGVLVGLGIGMLMAPRPGHELRSRLGDRLRSTRAQATEAITSATREVASH